MVDGLEFGVDERVVVIAVWLEFRLAFFVVIIFAGDAGTVEFIIDRLFFAIGVAGDVLLAVMGEFTVVGLRRGTLFDFFATIDDFVVVVLLFDDRTDALVVEIGAGALFDILFLVEEEEDVVLEGEYFTPAACREDILLLAVAVVINLQSI